MIHEYELLTVRLLDYFPNDLQINIKYIDLQNRRNIKFPLK